MLFQEVFLNKDLIWACFWEYGFRLISLILLIY